MKVAFGTTVLAKSLQGAGIDGIGTYTHELIRHMPADVALEPFSFGAPYTVSERLGASGNAGSFQAQALVSLAVGREFSDLRRMLDGSSGGGVSVVHSTDHYIPKLSGVPVVATIFDAIPLSSPQWVAYRFKRVKNELWRRTAFWADHVITISNYAREQLIEYFRISPERITSIPLGVGAQWFIPTQCEVMQRIRQHYGLPPRYLVNVGTLQPRKNIRRLLRAHAALPLCVQREYPLIILGKYGWGCEAEAGQLTSGALAHVRWLGHVPDEVVQAVVKQAAAMVFPSLMEGFGLPVLEAMAAGVPVVASDTTSIPEIAGDAAILVDPENEGAIADGILRIVEDASAAAKYVARGSLRAGQFSWEQCAAETKKVYERVSH